MSTNPLLPILREKSAAMQLCSICPVPGACCKGFSITIPGEGEKREEDRIEPTFWISSWREDAAAWLELNGLDFIPATICETFKVNESGNEYVTVRFNCPHLTHEGRCGIYETRPRICRQYLPMENDLCKFPR